MEMTGQWGLSIKAHKEVFSFEKYEHWQSMPQYWTRKALQDTR